MAIKIEKVRGYEILDSRGNPTVKAEVLLSDGSVGVASVPSGASTGINEAAELRDGEEGRYCGKGVTEAVKNINIEICKAAASSNTIDQSRIDSMLINLDGTDNKSRLGANAILAVSLALAKASASHYRLPLYKYIGGISADIMPIPMMNILNGGAHAANNIDIQEYTDLANTTHISESEFEIMAEMLSNAANSLDNMTVAQKRTALRSIIRRIEFDGENVHIYFFGSDENEIDLSEEDNLEPLREGCK